MFQAKNVLANYCTIFTFSQEMSVTAEVTSKNDTADMGLSVKVLYLCVK